MSPHGALTEPSRTYRVVTHDRKGREGKGSGRTGPRFIHNLRLLAARLMDGSYAETGGR